MTCQAQGNDQKRYLVCSISTMVLVGNEFLCVVPLQSVIHEKCFLCKGKSNVCFSFLIAYVRCHYVVNGSTYRTPARKVTQL
jgi:hypothetical protein